MEEALRIDITMVELLLSRNRPVHGSTKYFQRMKMVLQCIRRYNVLDFSSRLHNYIKNYSKKDKEWTIEDETNDERKYFEEAIRSSFPELISRIEHAAKSFFLEISRGFFMNYCTVCVAALARIRTLVQHLGREGIVELHKIGLNLNSMMNTYVPSDDEDSSNERNLKLLVKSLGIQWKDSFFPTNNKKKKVEQNKNNVGEDNNTTTSQKKKKKTKEDTGERILLDKKNPVLVNKLGIDRNLEFVMKANEKKKKKSNVGEGNKKQKKDIFDEIMKANEDKKMKKKKKKKRKQGEDKKSNVVNKKQKKDIFDDIFGD